MSIRMMEGFMVSGISSGMSCVFALLLGGAEACTRNVERDFEIVAPGFHAPKVQFAKYSYPPVSSFAEKRGGLFPFIDANDDGTFDPQTEVSGRCDLQRQ